MTFFKPLIQTALLLPLLAVIAPKAAGADFWLQNPHNVQVRAENRDAGSIFLENFLRSLAGQYALPLGDVAITIKDASTGAPLAGVTVLLGSEEGIPFKGNKLTTDSAGRVAFSAPELQSHPTLSVTAKKLGYAVTTIYSTNANTVEMALQPDPNPNAYGFLQGKLLGFPPGYNSRTMELGIFLPGFRIESLLNFDPQQIVSSYKVPVDIYGERQIPGNVVFPPQDKTYIFFPVHLEKPEFIMPLPIGMKTHMSGIVGAVNISDAISAMKERDFLQILNLATLTHTNWTSERVTVNGHANFDLTVQQAITQKAITSRYQNIPARLDAVAITMVDPTGDRGDFIPVDVKSLKSESISGGRGSIQLGKLNQNYTHYVFTGLFDRNQFAHAKRPDGLPSATKKRAITGSIVKLDGSNSANQQSFFQIMQTQQAAKDARFYRFTSPNNTAAGIQANFLILNVYSEKYNELTRGRSRHIFWTAVLPGTSTEVTLPKIDNFPILPEPDIKNEEAFYWEVIAVKGSTTDTTLNTKAALDSLEYLSNTVDLF